MTLSQAKLCWRTPVLLLALLQLTAIASAQEVARTLFKVGVARRDITPSEPVPMWGYGARHDTLSAGLLDPLYAETIVIQVGDTKIAVVGLDLGRSPSERSLQNIRRRIKDEAGIAYSFIAGSHTHHGPVLELSDEEGKGRHRFDAMLRYYKQMENQITQAIFEANTKLTPAKMAAGSIQLAEFNRNRHTKIQPKPSDRELAVMRFDDMAGKTLALLVNFAAHPTMIPAATRRFSADFVGAMKQIVSSEMKANVIFMQGAAGDQSANEGSNKGYEAFGRALGREAVKLASGLRTEEVAQPALEVREDRFKFTARVNLADKQVRILYEKAFFPELIANYIDEYADGIRPRLTVALLNKEVAFVGVSGEFFSNHSLRLKERARIKQLFYFGYCNGYHQYFPTIEAVAEGGYGADSQVSPAAVGAGEQMMDTALVWIYQMLGRIKK